MNRRGFLFRGVVTLVSGVAPSAAVLASFWLRTKFRHRFLAGAIGSTERCPVRLVLVRSTMTAEPHGKSSSRPNRIHQFGWLLLLGLSAYYLYRALSYRFFVPDQLGPTLLNKKLWFYLHLAAALPVLVGAPLQFSTRLRLQRPQWHRVLGRVYVGGAVIAATTAIVLGILIEYEGSRVPIILLGLLWLFFTLAAWRTAVRHHYAAHRLFMIRSYGLALVLVWLRLLGDIPEQVLFFYIQDQAVRDTTLEWLSWVLPLLVLETYLSWWPLLRGRVSR